jgi:hypothetical protein
MATVIDAVEGEVPMRTEYNQWNQFEDFRS